MGLSKIRKYLPFTSLIEYQHHGRNSDLANGKKALARIKELAHGTYATISMTALAFYGLGVLSTGYEANRVRILEVDRQRTQITEVEKRRHDELEKMLFGENGLADTNRDNAIDFHERVDAYRRIGYTKMFVEGRIFEFPTPTLAQLEKAVESYTAQKR